MQMDFFRGQRRKMELVDCYIKLNAQNEKRICLGFAMPLTGQPMQHMPREVQEANRTIATLENGITEATIDKTFKAQTLEFFSVDTGKRRFFMLTGADLGKLQVKRPVKASGPEKEVTLSFTTTVPFQEDTWQFGGEYMGMTFWTQFEPGQYEIEAEGEEGGEGESETQGTLGPKRVRGGKAAAAGEEE